MLPCTIVRWPQDVNGICTQTKQVLRIAIVPNTHWDMVKMLVYFLGCVFQVLLCFTNSFVTCSVF